jgi:small ligand-binding sensory domain FIST
MAVFAQAHATHPDWRIALSLVAAQIEAQRPRPSNTPVSEATLGWVYFSSQFTPYAHALFAALKHRWPGVAWVGASSAAIMGSGVQYHPHESAISLMLSDISPLEFRVFSGMAPLDKKNFAAHKAQVHADSISQDLPDLVQEMGQRIHSHELFGGIASGAGAVHLANGIYCGGLSGVAFSAQVHTFTRSTQGCYPLGPVRRITRCQHNLITELDHQSALDCLMQDLGIEEKSLQDALPQLQETLVALGNHNDVLLSIHKQLTPNTLVRPFIGIDRNKRSLAIGQSVQNGMPLVFCTVNTEAARRDLVRICSEIREDLDPHSTTDKEPMIASARRIVGAVYASCARAGNLSKLTASEATLIRHSLGDVPWIGFLAAGTIDKQHLYSHSRTLTVFTEQV